MHSSAHLLRAAGLALALALVPAAPAANVVLWNFDISTTGNDVFWDSTTQIDAFAPEFDYTYNITKVEVDVKYLIFTFKGIDITGQIPPEYKSQSGTLFGPPPLTLIDQLITYPLPPEPPGITAYIKVTIDAAGFGHLSATQVVLGTVMVPIPGFGTVPADLEKVRLVGEVTVKAILKGDINRDAKVDQADLGALLTAYGTCLGDPNYNPAADFDGSGCIDQSDLGTLLGNYGYGT